MMTRSMWAIAALALTALASVGAASQQPAKDQDEKGKKLAQEAEIKAAREILREAERRLDQLERLWKNRQPPLGFDLERELLPAKVTVAKYRVAVALLEKKTKTVLEYLNALVDLRREYSESLVKARAVDKLAASLEEINEATVNLAEVRILHDLYTILQIREAELEQLEQFLQAGRQVEAEELNKARLALRHIRERVESASARWLAPRK